jgi:TorA maturation chaperone TorD
MGTEAYGIGRDAITAQDVEARGRMYRFLSAMYLRPPTPELLRQIVAEDFLEALASLLGAGAVAELRRFAACACGGCDFASVEQEYMDLFAVPTDRFVTPFEDVYRGTTLDGQLQRGPLLGERAVAVIRSYREAAAEMTELCNELPTHIGVELSFMSFLCEREAEAIRCGGRTAPDEGERVNGASTRYRDLQIQFLQEHLNVWFPHLSRVIQDYARPGLYRGLPRITEEFLSWDAASLTGSRRE